MKSTELNPSGNFNPWQPYLLKELKNNNISDSLGQQLLFENDMVKIWDVRLLPGERLPFRKINCNCSFVTMTNGLVITRSGNGSIYLLHLEHGDSQFMPFADSESIYDLENIGENLLILQLSEFKPTHITLNTLVNRDI